MTENFVQLPTDTSNTGKKIRTNQRTVGANSVEEHYMIIQGSGIADFQAQVISGPVNTATGLAVWSMQAGSSEVYQTTATDMKVDIGNIGSVKIIPGDRVAGSIVDMPTVTVSATDLDIRDLSSAQDSISLGSVALHGVGSVQLVPGSLEVYQTTASDMQISGIVTVSGIFHDIIGSTSVQQDTIPWITSGTSTVAGSVYTTGSLRVANLYEGSEVWQGTDPWVISGVISNLDEVAVTVGSEAVVTAGSIQTYDPIGIGSVHLVPGSLEVYQTTAADMQISGTLDVDIITDPVPVSGIVNLGNQWTGVGSVVISGTVPVTATVTVGSESVITAGSVEVYQETASKLQISGTVDANIITDPVPISGVVNQGTDPWSISGTVRADILTSPVPVSGVVNVGSIVGSIAITNFAALGSKVTIPAGSVIITNELTIGEVGSPCYKRATLVASGTYTNVWPIGGGGSKFEMHGYHISTDKPGYVRIAISGTALATTQAGVIVDYHLNYDSGAAIEKTFSTPIIPNGAGSPVGFGTTVAGSTLVTFYGREVK